MSKPTVKEAVIALSVAFVAASMWGGYEMTKVARLEGDLKAQTRMLAAHHVARQRVCGDLWVLANVEAGVVHATRPPAPSTGRLVIMDEVAQAVSRCGDVPAAALVTIHQALEAENSVSEEELDQAIADLLTAFRQAYILGYPLANATTPAP